MAIAIAFNNSQQNNNAREYDATSHTLSRCKSSIRIYSFCLFRSKFFIQNEMNSVWSGLVFTLTFYANAIFSHRSMCTLCIQRDSYIFLMQMQFNLFLFSCIEMMLEEPCSIIFIVIYMRVCVFECVWVWFTECLLHHKIHKMMQENHTLNSSIPTSNQCICFGTRFVLFFSLVFLRSMWHHIEKSIESLHKTIDKHANFTRYDLTRNEHVRVSLWLCVCVCVCVFLGRAHSTHGFN